jgi:hypothetical protein
MRLAGGSISCGISHVYKPDARFGGLLCAIAVADLHLEQSAVQVNSMELKRRLRLGLPLARPNPPLTSDDMSTNAKPLETCLTGSSPSLMYLIAPCCAQPMPNTIGSPWRRALGHPAR